MSQSHELSPCGSNCETCPYYQQADCRGCDLIRGKVFWAKMVSAEVCPIYNCVINERNFEHCGFCKEVPCKLWKDLKDPSLSDQEHEQSIKIRAERLRKLINSK